MKFFRFTWVYNIKYTTERLFFLRILRVRVFLIKLDLNSVRRMIFTPFNFRLRHTHKCYYALKLLVSTYNNCYLLSQKHKVTKFWMRNMWHLKDNDKYKLTGMSIDYYHCSVAVIWFHLMFDIIFYCHHWELKIFHYA